MTNPWTSDLRVVGAAIALILDATLLGLASVLVMASVSPAWGLVLAGTVGLPVGAFLGWRYGRAAAVRRANWQAEALAIVLLVDASLVAGIVFQAADEHVDGGVAGMLSFLAYEALIGTIAAVALTCLVVVPLGLAWTYLLRRVAATRPERSSHHTG
jgi:hypothetical protein